jgi:hypothetical protein
VRKNVPLIFLTLLVIASTLAAQEPKPATPEKAPTTPLEQPIATSNATHALLYVYRHKQFAGSGLEPSVYLDEKQLARMDNGRYFVVKVQPGKHTIRSNDKQSGVEMELAAGKSYYIRVEIATGFMKGHGRLMLMQPEQATYEVKKLQPLGPDKIVDKEAVLNPPPASPAG